MTESCEKICLTQAVSGAGWAAKLGPGVLAYALAGGHSVEDPELKYGLSVAGLVHPDKLLTKRGARPGDKLILTKSIGTGIVATAVKQKKASKEAQTQAEISMLQLNRKAAEILADFKVNACTDVTGYGLLGHLCEMFFGQGIGARIQAAAVPMLPGTIDYAAQGMVPGGLGRNREFRVSMVDIDPSVHATILDVLFDPQTFGGLLIAVAPKDVDALLNCLKKKVNPKTEVIGEIIDEKRERILVR
ncbi:MAG: selenide, water dikinase SelD [Pseudomonadota bacterium]